MFRRLPVVTETCREADLRDPLSACARDTITLGWDERIRAHGRRRSDGGIEFGTALPRGTILREGDCLVLDAVPLVVMVVEKPEPVFVIEPRTAQEWGLFAYEIGNRHQPLMITSGALVCPELPGVEQLLQQRRIPYARAMMPFTPATAPMGHQH